MKIELAPGLDKVVAKKIKTGAYLDAAEVIRDSLRRWQEQEDAVRDLSNRLEAEIQAGIDSPDLPASPQFWKELRQEMHRELKKAATRG